VLVVKLRGGRCLPCRSWAPCWGLPGLPIQLTRPPPMDHTLSRLVFSGPKDLQQCAAPLGLPGSFARLFPLTTRGEYFYGPAHGPPTSLNPRLDADFITRSKISTLNRHKTGTALTKSLLWPPLGADAIPVCPSCTIEPARKRESWRGAGRR